MFHVCPYFIFDTLKPTRLQLFQVAETLRSGHSVLPEEFEEVTIFFSDVEGFTNICASVNPIQVVNMLNELYTVMDYCTSLFPLYKVETIGDAYMVRCIIIQ